MKFLIALTLGASLALAQTPPTNQAAPSPQMQAAGRLLQGKQFAEAAKAYEAIVAQEPENGAAWYQLAMSRFSLEQFRAAIEAFEKNIALTKNPMAMYNGACAYARLKENDKAIEWLQRAAATGLPPFVNVAEDSDLAGLRPDARFQQVVASLDKARRPCLYAAEARQFDFWVGHWNVFNPQGQQAGTSEIQQVAEGCGILENWRSRAGTTGKSLNFYDATSKKWHQYWIGSTGMPGRYSGTYSDGALRYEAEPAVVNGQRVLGKLTFFHVDANTVRQLAEQSKDDGKTWLVLYDFKYVRKQ